MTRRPAPRTPARSPSARGTSARAPRAERTAPPRASLGARWWTLLVCFGLFALLILGRAVQLQAVEGAKWRQAAIDQQRERVPLPARRGGIYDRRGVPLALTHETYRVSVAPRELSERGEAERALVKTLGLSAAQARRATDPSRRWVVLPGSFTAEQRGELGRLRGFHFERRVERFYPQGDIGREITGVLSGDGRALGGIEQQMHAALVGEPGYTVLRRDAHGRMLPAMSLPLVPPTDGADVYLTIDFDMQEIADGALRSAIASTGASGGDLLIADPHTGEILAAVSRRAGPNSTLAAMTEPYEPGSTLKPFLIATLLGAKRVSLGEMVDAEGGTWMAPGRRTPIRDTHAAGMVTVADGLRFSSNVVMAKLANRLSPAEQYAYLRDYGFGTPTGVEYPAESAGRLRRPQSWSATSRSSLAMGYELSVTPLQLAMAYGALANGGTLMEPHLVRSVRAPGGNELYRLEPVRVRTVSSPEITRPLTQVLVSVVDSGTAKRASLTTFDVAGKTGTARRTGAGGRYETGSYTATFVGYFPAGDPQLVIYVKLDQPQGAYMGGAIAAPVTREALQAILAARSPALEGKSLLTTARAALNGRTASDDAAKGGAAATRGEWAAPPGSTGGPYVLAVDSAEAAEEGAPAPTGRVTVPELGGRSMRDGARRLHALGLSVRLKGSGLAAGTQPAAGATVARGDTVTLIGGAQ